MLFIKILAPSIFSIFTLYSAMWFGRTGERVANTLRSGRPGSPWECTFRIFLFFACCPVEVEKKKYLLSLAQPVVAGRYSLKISMYVLSSFFRIPCILNVLIMFKLNANNPQSIWNTLISFRIF